MPLAILILVVVGTIVLGIAMFTELGTKHKTGKMKSTKTQHKNRKK
jgi:TRAP-type mannitol/chloroaromatic compound transport system permease large subunit